MKQDFLFEIFTEELPHGSLDPERGECRKIFEALEKRLIAEKVSYTGKDFYLTPRRIAMIFRQMEETLPNQEKITKGPPLSLCFQDGNPTKVLTGFVKGFSSHKKIEEITSVDVLPLWENKSERLSGFYRQGGDKQTFLIYYETIPARRVSEVLLQIVPEVLKTITFTKSMYWGKKQGPFLRPIRSLLALWGKEVVPLVFSGLTAGNTTEGHRFLSSGKVSIPEASHYPEILSRKKVIVDPDQRVAMIMEKVEAIEKQKHVRAVNKKKIALIVSRLTEYPMPAYAEVEAKLIQIPREVVVSEMVEHQIYFPVEDEKGNLTPGFIFTSNGIITPEIVTGNRNVLSSRLGDGIFLFQEDLKAGLENLAGKTDRILFEKTLGNYADKCHRTSLLASVIKKHAGKIFYSIKKEKILPMLRLCKCDLASGMVYEFPHLQGIMGKYYAQKLKDSSFEGIFLNQEMINAIWEHYLPLSAQGEMPLTSWGILLSLADKIDNLMGLFAVGLIPSGNNDPYALRRQGYGLVRLIIENRISFSLKQVLDEGANNYDIFWKENKVGEVIEFLESRFKTYAKDNGFAFDEVEAVSFSDINFYDRYLKMEAIREARSQNSFSSLLAGIKRISNILEKNSEKFSYSLDKNYFIINAIDLTPLREKTEQELLQTYQKINSFVNSLSEKNNRSMKYKELLNSFGQYPPLLERFFTEVMVNVEQENLRLSRIGLLQAIKSQINFFFHLSKIRITDN